MTIIASLVRAWLARQEPGEKQGIFVVAGATPFKRGNITTRCVSEGPLRERGATATPRSRFGL